MATSYTTRDGKEVPIVAATDDEFRKWYTPTGNREAWLRAAKLLTDRKRPELDILISIGFAAPLMAFAGALYGALLSVWGEPGSSKSTAQHGSKRSVGASQADPREPQQHRQIGPGPAGTHQKSRCVLG